MNNPRKYKNISLLFFYIFIFLFTSPVTLASLFSFYSSLTPESQNLLKWNYTTTSESPCQLHGITCSSFSPYPVLSLNISGLGLTGHLATSIPHLCSLPYLNSLDLSTNKFTGPIPSELINCSRLEIIHLEENSLSGTIPSTIFMSRSLVTVNLGNNSLTGLIPTPQAEILPFLQLEYLALYNNSLTGEIPNELLQLPNLTFLYLYHNNLTGPIPNFPSYCNLIELYIYENNLQGEIPPSLGNCRNLTSFDASTNKIEGTLSNETFCKFQHLEILYLQENNLTGALPSCIWSLANLTEVFLSSNNFNSTIPQEIGMCRSLVILSLWGNQLTGSIPVSIGNLTNMELLELALNSLSGPIPREICELGGLQKLYLFKNKIEGTIPMEIWKMQSLVDLQLYNNSLIGEIPREITLLNQLSYISLAYNNLTGEVPYSLGNTPNNGLVRVDLTGNSFSGPVPPYLCSGSSLEILDLGYNRFNSVSNSLIFSCSSLTRVILRENQLNGSLPAYINSTSEISYFDLSTNFFQGNIPKGIGSWKNLTKLDFSNNLFSGTIPTELGTLTNIETINLASNRLTGSIPDEWGSCQKLLLLDLSQNLLSGQIPVNVLTLANLQYLLLQNNKLTGPIPDSFSAGLGLLELQLGDNLLDGPIPWSLGNLQYIYLGLNMSINNLTGQIPGSFSNLDKLQVLDISHNSLSGPIPSSLNNMISLSTVNLSFNGLSGDIPSSWGKFVISSPGSFSGNENLKLQDLNHNHSTPETKQSAKVKKWVVALVIALGASIFVAGLCMAKYVVSTRARARARSLSSKRLLSSSTNSTSELPEDLTYDDIMRATDNLSEKFVIGRGRHGTVYCTELGEGKRWAVKMVDLTQLRFCHEMQILGSVKHRNLVKMAGYCIRDNIGLIVCEYVPGGDLFELLHQKRPTVALGWRVRYKISLGMAQALAYLHHDCMPMILHRDVKSSNVLLDFELEPKLADFGLARFVDVKSDLGSSVSAIVGTLGYIAPENGYATKINEKCDVYSYGVMLLELLCRRLPVDSRFGDGVDIVQWINFNLNRDDNFNGLDCLDEEIWYWEVDEREKALQLLELAVSCTQFQREARPTMREVVNVLIKLHR